MDQIGCPACGKTYRIDASYQGRSFPCHCGQIVSVPGPAGTPPPPPGAPPPPPSYYAAPPAYQPDTGRGTTAFVLGLLGLILCVLCAPFAWSIGSSERKRAMEMGAQPDGMATAGWVMGIIGTILLIVGVVFFLIWAIFAAAVVGGSVG